MPSFRLLISPLLLLVTRPAKVLGFGVVCDELETARFNMREGQHIRYSGVTLKMSAFLLGRWFSAPARADTIYKFGGRCLERWGTEVNSSRYPPLDRPLRRLSEKAHSEALRYSKEEEASLQNNVTRYFGPRGKKRVYTSIEDLHRAFRSGSADPVTVAEGAMEAAVRLNRVVNAVEELLPRKEVLAMAEASKARFAAGQPLSMLDGVTFMVKNDINVKGIRTMAGRRTDSKVGWTVHPAEQHDRVVARLLSQGAILIGVGTQSELGLSATGFNGWKKGPLNPHNPKCFTGGSSSGIAVAVAMGLVPFAIGTDANGCNRSPAALTGVVGMAPTYGRVPLDGPLAEIFTNVHLGPITANAEDAAHVMAVIAENGGKESLYDSLYKKEFNQTGVPRMHLRAFTHPPKTTVTVGIYRAWVDSCSKSVIKAFYGAVEKMPGWKFKYFTMPQMAGQQKTQIFSLAAEYGELLRNGSLSSYERSSQMSIALARQISKSQRKSEAVAAVRGWAMGKWEALFRTVDFVAVPTVYETAPIIPEDYFNHRPFDPNLEEKLLRSTWVTNLLGYPSISVPMGVDDEGMPIGLQIIGRHWEDDRLMKVASDFQARTEASRAKPEIFKHELL